MTTTAIKFPALPAGMTLTTELQNLATLSVLETVSLTEASGVYSGDVTGTHSGQLLFVLKSGSAVIGHRVRTIADDAGPYIILTELETLASDGRGARVVTITIDDGTDPVVGATVGIYGAGVSVTGTTNGSGVVKFALNDGDYDVIIEAVGYEIAIETLTVSGATPETYSLTAYAVTLPDSPLLATGIGIVYDETETPEPNVPVSIQKTAGPGIAGNILDTKVRTFYSDESGVVTIPRLRRGATYAIWRGAEATSSTDMIFATRSSGARKTFVVDNFDIVNLPELLGLDAE